jgi:hypothetical protein
MHIEKNVMDNILDTILDIKRKTKDNFQARKDLQEMSLRHTLHPFTPRMEKSICPKLASQCPMKIKQAFFKVLRDVRVPDGCSLNISICV